VPDDYAAAAMERRADVLALVRSARKRCATHLGGVALECRLKELALLWHGVTAFQEQSLRPGHGLLRNPKHDLHACIGLVPPLRERLIEDERLLADLEQVIRPPLGAGDTYIAQRYAGSEPLDADFAQWLAAFRRVNAWLVRNVAVLAEENT